MGNPNWLNFPGLPNMTTDGDGRPQVLDLVPGKQPGTPLEALLFNPIIKYLCDLRDAIDAQDDGAVSGTFGRDIGAGDLKISGLYWQGSSVSPIVVYQDTTDKWQFVRLATATDLNEKLDGLQPRGDYQAAGDYATNPALADETQRAEAAEAGKVAKSGDTISGNLNFASGVSVAPWAVTNKAVFSFSGSSGQGLICGQIDGDGHYQTLLYTQDVNGSVKAWDLRSADGCISTPHGNNLLETGNTGAPRMRQCFRVSVANGAAISWPIAYARDDLVTATFTPTDNGNGQVHIVNLLVGTTTSRFGCAVAVATWNIGNNGNMEPDSRQITLDVTVEGWAA